MKEQPKYKEYNYVGGLATLCADFIKEKRGVGYIYNTEAKHLAEFSRFSANFKIENNTLSKEIVDSWIFKRPSETARNQYARVSLLRQFALYIIRVGYKAYVPTKATHEKTVWQYTPHIFTPDEVDGFFKAADALTKQPHSGSPLKHIVMPLLFRVLYACGLRVTEALTLTMEDINLNDGIIHIKEGKFDVERYIPMSDSLTKRMVVYAQTYRCNSTVKAPFFPSFDGNRYDARSIYSVFRDLLWAAAISHGGRGKGPRVHDFRHTFAVRCLEQWVADGKDLSAALPYLMSYLGHKTLSATGRYLRLTAEIYPHVMQKINDSYAYVIPTGGVWDE